VSEEDNIKKLPVSFKKRAPEDRTVVRPWEVGRPAACSHLMATYLIRDGEAEVECGRCGTRLDPMWVLAKIATEDRRWAESQARYQEEQKRLAERKRTKCDHCGAMTRISRR
jgi:hypothetical protein